MHTVNTFFTGIKLRFHFRKGSENHQVHATKAVVPLRSTLKNVAAAFETSEKQ